jgi:hypothetical protein
MSDRAESAMLERRLRKKNDSRCSVGEKRNGDHDERDEKQFSIATLPL